MTTPNNIGAGVYTVSILLGHIAMSRTQVYWMESYSIQWKRNPIIQAAET